MSRIVVDWDRESGKADYQIEGMSHVEAMRVLLVVVMDCLDHALVEAETRKRGMAESAEGGFDGHEFHGYCDRGERERGGV